jgi:hypothetical protein
LISGLARGNCKHEIVDFVRAREPGRSALELSIRRCRRRTNGHLFNFLYYATRCIMASLHTTAANCQELVAQRERRQASPASATRSCLDVEAQIIEMNRLDAQRIDPRLRVLSDDEWDLLRREQRHHPQHRLPAGHGGLSHFQPDQHRGRAHHGRLHVLGKAATLNGRVGDVMIPNVVYDEHSQNTFLFRNCFRRTDVSSSAQLWHRLRQPEGGDRARHDPAEPQLHARLL